MIDIDYNAPNAYIRFRCTLTADRARRIGWKPKFRPENILEMADAEVELILANLKE